MNKTLSNKKVNKDFLEEFLLNIKSEFFKYTQATIAIGLKNSLIKNNPVPKGISPLDEGTELNILF